MSRKQVLTLMASFFLALPISAHAVTHNVSIGDNFFSPTNLTINVGDTVRWTYSGDRLHDATADDFSWASPTSTSIDFSHTFNSVDVVPYHCTVHSSPGGSSMNGTISVVAVDENQPPTANFSFNCSDLDCDFTDTSTDSDGTIASWSWNFDDGGSSGAQNPSHSYVAAGTYTVSLTVTDDDGAEDSVNRNVTVEAGGNQPPTANFSFNCSNLDCNFTDTSTDSDGTIAAWSWNFDDGGSSGAQNPSHSYAAAGTYTVGLTATDNDGAEDSVNRSVTVSEAAPDPIVINFGMTDAWFDPATDGQGMLIMVWENITFVFMAWFTYDTERPPEDVMAILGDPGARWLTASGPYEGDTATLDVFLTTGGVFDSEDPPAVTDPTPIGTVIIQWTSCNAGTLTYDIPSLGLMGVIPIQRIVIENVPICEAGQGQQ